MSSPKLWRGQTLEDRSHERRIEFLQAAQAILGESGAASVSMRAVVRRANLSPRYFYESFASREELLCAVYDDVEAQLLARITAIPEHQDSRATVRAVIEAFRDFFEEDAGRARVLLREPLADDVLREHSAARIPAFAHTLISTLDGENPPPADEDAWAIAATAMSGALVALYLDFTDGRLAVDSERLTDLTVDLAFAVRDLATAER